jgi:hypothetical protein
VILTRTNSRFGELVESGVAISLDLFRLSESGRVAVDLGPVDVNESTRLDLNGVRTSSSESNVRLSLTNETSNSGIQTESFVDEVLWREKKSVSVVSSSSRVKRQKELT